MESEARSNTRSLANVSALFGRTLLRGLALYPFAFAAVLGALFFIGLADWEKYFAPAFSRRALAAAAVLAAVLCIGVISWLVARRQERVPRSTRFHVVWAIALFALSLALRVAHNMAVGHQVEPISDFQ